MSTFKPTDIALVTGAGSGMGRETCKLLASQGATVVATDINEKTAQETVLSLTGKNHMSLKLDVSNLKDVEAVVKEIKNKYSSPPTIAVNCAALMLWEPFLDLTENTYNRFFDINFKGTVWVTQVVCRELLAAKLKGSIINISSIAKDGGPNMSIYGATKGAVESFSSSVAKELGPHGIRTNIILPGYVLTPMTKTFEEEINKYHASQIPLRRMAEPQEVAEVIVFVASDKASYVNGASLRVNGGYSNM